MLQLDTREFSLGSLIYKPSLCSSAFQPSLPLPRPRRPPALLATSFLPPGLKVHSQLQQSYIRLQTTSARPNPGPEPRSLVSSPLAPFQTSSSHPIYGARVLKLTSRCSQATANSGQGSPTYSITAQPSPAFPILTQLQRPGCYIHPHSNQATAQPKPIHRPSQSNLTQCRPTQITLVYRLAHSCQLAQPSTAQQFCSIQCCTSSAESKPPQH